MTSYSSIIFDYLGADVAANRPVSLNIAPTALGLYTATDTGIVSAWYGAAWHVVAAEGASVSEIVAGAGLSGGTITTSGTIALGTIAAGDLFGNPGSVAAVPSAVAIGSGLSLSAAGTLSNTGILTLSAGTGISISGGNTITNAGIVSLAAGANIIITGGNTIASSNPGGTVTQITAGTGLTGGTITAAGTIALDPLGNALAINSGTIDYNQTPTAFSAARTLAAADNGTWLVDSSGGTVDVVVTTPTFAAGTKFTSVLQNNSTTHNVILRPGAGATIDGAAGDYTLHTFTSSRIGIDSTGTAWIAEPGNIFWQPSAGYVVALGANLNLSANGTLSAVESADVARIASVFTSVGNPANTSENTLQTINLAAGQLASDGQAIRMRVGGQYTGAAAVKTFNVYFGATKIAGFSLTTGVDQILFDVIVMRSGATAQLAYGFGAISAAFASAGQVLALRSTPAETLSGAVAITVKAITSTGVANTIFCDFVIVEFLP